MSKAPQSHSPSEPNKDVDLFAEFARQFDRCSGSLPTTRPENPAAIRAESSSAEKR